MDIQRTVLWVVFSMSLLILWDNWMRFNGKPSMFFPTAVEQQVEQAPGATPAAGTRTDVPTASAVTPASSTAAPASGPAAPAGERVTITTDVLKAEIDSIGGQVVRLELLKHQDSNDPDRNVLLFESQPGSHLPGPDRPGGRHFPAPPHALHGTAGPAHAGWQQCIATGPAGAAGRCHADQTYIFKRDSYTIDIKHTVANESGAPVSPSVYAQLVRDGGKLEGDSMFYSTFTGPAVYSEEEKFQEVQLQRNRRRRTRHVTKANEGWIAMVQHYFVSAFLAPSNVTREFYSKKLDNNLYALGEIVPMGTIAPGASAEMDIRLYSGLQESARLEQLAPGLDLVKDYGMLTIVAKPIFWLMTQIHNVLGNWGWTIIVLTILIKLAFFPLSAASYRSMAKMRVVTPKMTAIRERHKGDPQKMNQAMMELYKTEKINPLGGCLPIVVQIPVFIALYWVLLASVEMRNAPWLGWIQDLASPDPWFILPVVMAVSMFIQTRLNPTPPDPIQAKVMLFMPIAFSVMFFFFPAGLVLYWVVNNILSIAQQWVITRKIEAGKAA